MSKIPQGFTMKEVDPQAVYMIQEAAGRFVEG